MQPSDSGRVRTSAVVIRLFRCMSSNRERKSRIRIMATGAVRDLGRPAHSGLTIRIAVRKTLHNFTFSTDYGTEPVVGKYQDLVVSGHEYVPRFSSEL
ncbi:hypothetical protein MTO96_028708 [Rhipicephalus appendiculatus]